ncbi:MAG: FkbM family methyltransferase [Thermonemataceae bacterium]|nr:FkbM family methyltransferase [Thermonemataceae bacterium]
MIHHLKKKLKKYLYLFLGKYKYLKIRDKRKHKWYGKEYSGFFVDTELIKPEAIVYSFGVGEDISFDRELIADYQAEIFAFDPTPKSIEWLSKQVLPTSFHFFSIGIATYTGEASFYLPKNKNFVSGSSLIQENVDVADSITVKMKKLSEIMTELGHRHIDVLKMDIEGSEYEVLEQILDEELSIGQILVEFHERFIENGAKRTEKIVGKMKDKGFLVFACSDSFEEVSFVNKKIAEKMKK